MNIEDYFLAKSVYENNENITSALKKHLGLKKNSYEIIEIAYDLQAGEYSKKAEVNQVFYNNRAQEVFQFIDANIKHIESMLDVGSGELTMFARVASNMSFNSNIKLFATDISLSRLVVGRKSLTPSFEIIKKINLVVADTAKLPFVTNGIDLIITDHSLEPNGGRLKELLRECFRVARRYCVFVEPSNALQSAEGLKRMESLGYIFDLEKNVVNLGGRIVARHTTVNNYNEMNKSEMLLVEVPRANLDKIYIKDELPYAYPGTDYKLRRTGDLLVNEQSGFVFPILHNVPLLLEKNRILFSKFNF
jgi:ubiquinone/menaquinone biosynthesis C-methylase UbiE